MRTMRWDVMGNSTTNRHWLNIGLYEQTFNFGDEVLAIILLRRGFSCMDILIDLPESLVYF